MLQSTLLRSPSRMLLALAIVVALGCQSSGPEFLDGDDTRVVQGLLAGEVTSQSDFFVVTRSGTVSVRLTSLSVADAETGEAIAEPDLAVSVGQPRPDDETVCQATFSQLLEEEDAFSVFFPEGLFCITAFRGPEAPTDTVIDYVVTLTGAFS